MPSRVSAIANYKYNSKDKLFFDANVWIYTHGPKKPRPTGRMVKIYSQALKDIIAAGSQIYTDVLVISEFVNRYSRTLATMSHPNVKNFKKFRQTAAFKPIAKDTADATRRVLGLCKRVGSEFEVLRIAPLVDEYAEGNVDFNDQIIIKICKANKLKLVTHDGDFKGVNIPVLTANQKLLS